MKWVWVSKEAEERLPELEGIIFDVDRTLINITNSYLVACNKTIKKCLELADSGVCAPELDANRFYRSWQMDEKADIWSITTWLVKYALLIYSERDFPDYEIVKIYQSIYKKLLDKENLIPDNKSCLDVLCGLSKSYKLGIATGRPNDECTYTITMLGLSNYFSEGSISVLEDGTKADRIIKSVKSMGTKNNLNAYVGDTAKDVESAIEVQSSYGVKMLKIGVLVTNEIVEPELYEKQFQILKSAGADIIIPNISYLPEVLK